MRKIALAMCLCIGPAIARPNHTDSFSQHIENDTGQYTVSIQCGDPCETVTVQVSRIDGKQSYVLDSIKNIGFLYVKAGSANDRVVSVWEAGTAFSTFVTPLTTQSRVRMECGSEIEPDFVNGSRTSYMIQYTGKEFVAGGLWRPRLAEIYYWDGNAYQLISRVPFGARFSELARIDSLHELKTPDQVPDRACFAR